MLKRQLNNRYKNYLKKLAIKIQEDLSKKIRDRRIIKIDITVPEDTNTFGWYIELFRFKGITGRGKVELWLDLFPNIEKPVLSICFWSTEIDRIHKVAKSFSNDFQDTHPTKVTDYGNGEVLIQPLARKYFNKYLIEPYKTKFLTCYFPNEIDTDSAPSASILKNINQKTEWLLRTIASALEIKATLNLDYEAIENRQIVSEHLRRERSKVLADITKRRDGFTCQVCDLNFSDKYGDLGRGFAEAHHITGLSKLKRKAKTTHEDLITVCANCHRMLHRMEGKADDFKELRKLFIKNSSR